MSGSSSNGGASDPWFAKILLKDFDACWAGPHPLRSGFCFGSEDGRILFTDENGRPFGEPMKGSDSGEAINGVARSGEWLAVTTRAELTMGSLLPETQTRRGAVIFPCGTHGIATAPSGYFVAPLGRMGIMMLTPGAAPTDPVGILSSAREGQYFYRVIPVQGEKGQDCLVCATRHGGIGITSVRWGQPEYNMRIATFNGLDVVDVCVVDVTEKSLAIAAIGRDGAIIMARDALHDKNPVTMKFKAVEGTAYRLLSANGHLFVLTSRALYGLMNLGEHLVQGLPVGNFTTPILVVPMDAVDASMVAARWLLTVLTDEIRRFDVELIGEGTPDDLQDGEIREVAGETLSPSWQIDDIKQLVEA